MTTQPLPKVFLLTTISAILAVSSLAQTPAPNDALLNELLDAVRNVQSIEPVKRQLRQGNTSEFPPEHIDFFETRVRPVLAEQCFECHGPERQRAGLRLDGRALALHGTESGPVIIPGNSAASPLVRAIQRTGEIKMPPDNPLPPDAIEAIAHWIELGAPWPTEANAPGPPRTMEEQIDHARATHWAFQPIAKPSVPAQDLAPIDAFIRQRLHRAGLTPAPLADKRTLIRRATFDLIGLPPTPQEVQDFVNDDSPEAFENVIDRLLASPRYGERWARYWLDIARYADTKGYVFQEDRNFAFSHTYRDYVINAFNDDLPYDQFLMHQLAADQMELGGDKRPLAAMGYLTLGRRFIGNVHDITDDRIDVVTRGMLGLTVSCARCHDHKYDPIPITDYYSLYGVFRSSVEPPEFPLIEEPDPEDEQYQAYVKALNERETALSDFLAARYVELMAHAREKIAQYLLAAHDARAITEDDPFQKLAKERELHWQLVGRWRGFLNAEDRTADPIFGPFAQFAAIPPEDFETKAPELAKTIAGNDGNPNNPRVAEAFNTDPPASMEEVAQRYGELLQSADKAWQNLLAAETFKLLAGAAITLPEALPDNNLEALRQAIYGKETPTNIPASQVEQYLDIPTRNRITNLRVALQNVKATHPGRPPRAMILTDLDKPFDPFVFNRGKPDDKGDPVPRQFLAVLANGQRTPFENGSGRLELARSIASPDNPLTARVFVNRVWMYHFGQPLVDTTSDFGLRSDPPTHPELLDYLAARFIEDGWSVKSLHRHIMLSHAYQQASIAPPQSIDPENRLLARQNRRRLDFEALRDTLLAVSGKLDLTTGGPSVEITRPPYPPRRTVYAHIERQNLPGLFRTFDFAGPDTHSPRRYRTTVPQQALFMMNSPFVIDQARAVTNREPIANTTDTTEQVRNLYQLLFQREPTATELATARNFLEHQGEPEPPTPPTPPAWSYGYGGLTLASPDQDTASRLAISFTPLPHYANRTWKGGPDLPDPHLGWVSINDRGGHPGAPNNAAIRRWTAPYNALVTLNATLRHPAEQGDGVTGYILHAPAADPSTPAILWSQSVHNATAQASIEELIVHQGDIIDFVAAPNETEAFDSFTWTPHISLLEDRSPNPNAGGRSLEWHARTDFAGPPPVLPDPLTPIEELTQVLLLTNEFAFID